MANPLILVADDEPDFRRAMRRCLNAHDYSVLEAANGYELVELFKANMDARMIFTDFYMPPGITGLEALKGIRDVETSLNSDRRIPVVLVSADEGILRASRRQGKFTDTMQKPYTLMMLMEMVGRHAR